MTDIKLVESQIEGFKSKIAQLRKDERVFLKMQGIDEQIEKSRSEIINLETDVTAVKEDLAELKSQKTKAIVKTAQKLSESMSTILPTGKAIFHIDDEDNVHIGWHISGEQISPYDGLSGSEKAQFDVALAYALLGDSQCKVLILEGSEMDEEHLSGFLNHLSDTNPDAQIIVNHWTGPQSTLSTKWNVIHI